MSQAAGSLFLDPVQRSLRRKRRALRPESMEVFQRQQHEHFVGVGPVVSR
jgi:hypothetical protein